MEDRKSNTIVAWVHTWHTKKPEMNCVGVKEKVIYLSPDNEPIYTDRIRVYEDPRRPFWVTKPQYRTYQYKKEFGDMDKCEKFVCHDSELEYRLAKALGYYSQRKMSLRVLCNSPYVYGADIETAVLIKQAYLAKMPTGFVPKYSVGGLDIENEVHDEGKINIITFIHEDKIFTGVLKDYAKVEYEPDKFRDATKEDFNQVIYKLLGFYFERYHFKLELEILPTELSLIKWIFARIHECKTDFIGVWNLSYDIPKIMDRITALGGDLEDIMCHPDVPKQYRWVNWYFDPKDVQHYTDKWHWLSLAGYSQFLDSMCLYARLRKVSGRDSSYSLDSISTKELGHGKLHFGAITNHAYVQKHNFLEYTAYNINDAMVLMLMEKQNNDMSAVAGLCGQSILSQFARQTVLLKNDAYVYGKSRGKIPASAGTNMFSQYDNEQLKSGGAVLPPNKAVNVGTAIVEELGDKETQVCLYTNDLDFSSLYPTVTSSFNISKETILSTVLSINGMPRDSVEVLFGYLNRPDINGVPIGTQFFGLPNYQEWHDKFTKYLESQQIN